MAEKIKIRAVEMVRHIRDKQAAMLSGKSRAEIISFFKKAEESVCKKMKRVQDIQSKTE